MDEILEYKIAALGDEIDHINSVELHRIDERLKNLEVWCEQIELMIGELHGVFLAHQHGGKI